MTSFLYYLAIGATALATFAVVTNSLAHLFAALGWARAQRIAERVGIIIVAVEHAAEDAAKAAPAGPVAMGVAALKDLEPLAELDASGKATIAIARVKTMAKAFGVVGLVLVLVGCGGAAGELVHMVQVEGRIVTAAEPCLVKAYKAEQQACIDDHRDAPVAAAACVAAVRARSKPLIDALAEEHDTRCKLEPAKCPAEGK